MKYAIAAGVLGWSGIAVTIVAFFMGRDRLIDDYKRYCAEYAKEHQGEVQR